MSVDNDGYRADILLRHITRDFIEPESRRLSNGGDFLLKFRETRSATSCGRCFMKLFRTEANTVVLKPAPTPKAPVIEGWSEQQLVSVWHAGAITHMKHRDPLLGETHAS